MIFTSWGAAQQVTGSKHLLDLPGGTRVLIDCGLDYERRKEFEDRNANFPFDPCSIDLLILTHAHIDHSGNVPNLIKQGFDGEILCTAPTLELSDFLLRDSLNIQRMEAMGRDRKKGKKNMRKTKRNDDQAKVLYASRHIKEMMEMAIVLDWNEPYRFNDELVVEFCTSGHILGASSAVLTVEHNGTKKRIGFTGDLGNYGSKLVPDPQPMEKLNYLISESTYGGRNHISDTGDACGELLNYIEETCVKNGGKLVIPAFSVGRTQAIIFALHQLYREGVLPKVKIFTDSPLAIRSTAVYEHNPEFLNSESLNFRKQHGSLFDFPLLHVIEDEKESELLSLYPEPCVIISAAGMVEGGRIQMHIRNNVGHPDNTILIAGFCAEGTLGHRLLQGQENVEINYKPHPVRASISRTDAFSAHPDHNGLLKYLKESTNGITKGIFLVHGDAEQMELLAKDIDFAPVTIPIKGKSYKLEF